VKRFQANAEFPAARYRPRVHCPSGQ
jgi:hypothetical protein